MSSEYQVYIGPYAVCTCPVVETTKTVRACPNTKCILHRTNSGESFCCACGTAIDNVAVPVRKPAVDAWDMEERIDHVLRGPGGEEWFEKEQAGTRVWLASENRVDGGRDFHYDIDETEICDVQPSDITKEIAMFLTQYARALDALRSTYTTMDVRWGIIQYYD
jgi:hypothetical protein